MLEMRPLQPEEFAQWLSAESRAHGNRLDHDPKVLLPHFDLDRTIAVFDKGNIVGGANSHLVEMTIPGGSAMVAGVSNVAVQPTHTRRGIMTRMMRHQIEEIYQRGELLAALFATESIIYGRFGYGVGSLYQRYLLECQHNAYSGQHKSTGQINFVEPADITKHLPEVFRRCTLNRPGVFQRPQHQWQWDSEAPEHKQGGKGGLFYAAYENGGEIEGYVTYRTSGATLTVNELMATTREAYAALWRFCFDVDLFECTEAIKRPVDDPLPWMLADPRRLQRSTRDGLWLRLVDVAGSLELRRFAQDGRLVLDIRDDICPWNNQTFQLDASTEGVTCRPTDAAAHLVVPVNALASAYLGATSFSTLARAGLLEELSPEALTRADAMFAVQLQPWSPCNFG